MGLHVKIIDPLQKVWSIYKNSVNYQSVLQHYGQFYMEFTQQLLAGTHTALGSKVCSKVSAILKDAELQFFLS